MGIREEHGILQLNSDCDCGCRFCARSRGRLGTTIDGAGAIIRRMPDCRAVTIMGGDLLNGRIAPVIRLLRERGTASVFLYVHPATGNHDALAGLVRAGLTGLYMLLPAVDRKTLAELCGPAARLENAASLLKAAGESGLAVHLEIPVVSENFEKVPDVVERALRLVRHPHGITLPFAATHDAAGIGTWDFRAAVPCLARAVKAARDRDVPVIVGGREGAGACVLDLEGAVAGWYPELDDSRHFQQNKALPQCADCVVAGACVSRMTGFSETTGQSLSGIVRTAGNDIAIDPAAPVTTTELFLRRSDIDSLLRAASGIDRCIAPWDSLEAHDRTGRTAPCEGSWPKRAVLGTPDGRDPDGWIEKGLIASFNSPSMVRMRRTMVDDGRDAACGVHCPRFSETLDMRPAMPLPRTRVFFENMKMNLREFVDGADVLRSRPLHITVSPVLSCNQRCRMCDLNDADTGAAWTRTPARLFDEIVDLLPTTATLALTGGEPLMSREIIEIVGGITPENYPDARVTLTTNGTLLKPDVIERWKNSNLATVYISTNAATPATHELVTGTSGRFGQVIDNARAMIAAAATMPYTPSVLLSFVVMRTNIDELGDFILMARNMNAGIRLLPIERNRNGESLFTDIETLERAEGIVRGLRDRFRDGRAEDAAELGRLHRVIHAKMAGEAPGPLQG